MVEKKPKKTTKKPKAEETSVEPVQEEVVTEKETGEMLTLGQLFSESKHRPNVIAGTFAYMGKLADYDTEIVKMRKGLPLSPLITLADFELEAEKYLAH